MAKLEGDTRRMLGVSRHEAAHAIVGNIVGLKIAHIAIWDTGEPVAEIYGGASWGGECVWKKPGRTEQELIDEGYYKARLLATFAAPCADFAWSGKNQGRGHGDDFKNIDWLIGMVNATRGGSPEIDMETARAESMTLVVANLREIDALAHQLILTGRIEMPFG